MSEELTFIRCNNTCVTFFYKIIKDFLEIIWDSG